MTREAAPAEAGSFSRSVLRRYLGLFVVLINALALVLAVLDLRASLGHYQESARTEAGNLTRVLEENLSGSFDRINLALLSVADEFERQTAGGGIDRQTFDAFIHRLNGRLPELDSLRVTDAQGVIRYGVGVDPDAGVTGADRDYFIRQRDDPGAGLVFSKPLLGRISGKWTIVLSRRLGGPDGSFAGVVYAVITTEYFTEKFSRLQLEHRGSIALLGENLVLISRFPAPPPGSDVIGQSKPTPQALELLGSGRKEGDYIAVSPVDGVERLFSLREIVHYPFYVSVTLTLKDAFAAWRSEAVFVICLVVGLLIVTLVSSRVIYLGWSRQAQAAQALGLARDKLEERVAERTAELVESIDALEEAKDQAESGIRMKTAFLANISHELKTPLNPIIAFTDLALDAAPTQDMRENLTEVRKAAERLHGMIDNLIELTSLDSYRPEAGPISAKIMLDMLLREFAPAAAEKGLTLAASVDQGTPEIFEADLNLLRLTLMKIAENAIKFTDTGAIELRVSPGLNGNGPVEIRFAVRDTGIGVAGDKVDCITAGFCQADSPLTKHYRGLGLGLATAHKALELLEGRLEVASTPGKGSTFTVVLPLRD
jgi:signal transduction histidine kinase